jgi:hypothetical protein
VGTVVSDLSFLDTLEPSFTLTLIKPLKSADGKETYNSFVINEPSFPKLNSFIMSNLKTATWPLWGF